jgi:hypothetical protein
LANFANLANLAKAARDRRDASGGTPDRATRLDHPG